MNHTKAPLVSLEPLKGLAILNVLVLNNASIIDLSPLKYYPTLQQIYLANNNIISMDGLNSLTQVEVLVLNDNEVRNITETNNMSKLRSMNLAGNLILTNEGSLVNNAAYHSYKVLSLDARCYIAGKIYLLAFWYKCWVSQPNRFLSLTKPIYDYSYQWLYFLHFL